MKKSEVKALEKYPIEDGKMWTSAFGTFEFDRNCPERNAFQEGYEEAERDLSLTWEDMREITRIDIEMMDDPEEHPEWTEERSFYEEVLRRFMQIKEARK